MEFVGRNFFAIQKAQFLFTYCGKSRVQILTRARCQDSGYKPTFTLTPLRWSLSPNDATIKVLTVLWVISGLLSFFSKYRAFHDACGYIQMFFGIFCEVPNFFSSFRSISCIHIFVHVRNYISNHFDGNIHAPHSLISAGPEGFWAAHAAYLPNSSDRKFAVCACGPLGRPIGPINFIFKFNLYLQWICEIKPWI